MTNPSPQPSLTPADFTHQRSEAVTEAVKSLFWMNGGAAVAMLAFLQAIWTDNPSLSRYVVIGTAVFSFGVALAGIVQLIRYSASFNLQEGKRNRWQVLRCSYLAAAYGSIVVFIIGVGVIVCGAWCALR